MSTDFVNGRTLTCSRCGWTATGICAHLGLRELDGMNAENAALKAELAIARALLREVSSTAYGVCPSCLWHQSRGHTPDCRLDAFLRGK